jgi:cell division protein FtsL
MEAQKLEKTAAHKLTEMNPQAQLSTSKSKLLGGINKVLLLFLLIYSILFIHV